MKVVIENDHTAIGTKNTIVDHSLERGLGVLNLGVDSPESCDYPMCGKKVDRTMISGETDLDIAICGIEVGVSLAADKVKGIHARVCNEPCTAKLPGVYNDSNVLTFGARVIGIEIAKMITDE